MSIKIEAVVLDLDGTTLNSAHDVTPLTKDVLNKLQRLNIKVILASARPIGSVLKIADEIGLTTSAMIGGNGAIIADSKQSIFYQNSIPNFELNKIFPILKSYSERNKLTENTAIHIYSGFSWYVLSLNHLVREEMDSVGFSPSLMTEQEVEPKTADKIMCVSESSILVDLSSELKSVSPSLEFVLSRKESLEITAPNVSKYTGVEAYAKIFKLNLNTVLAIGDGDNDASMIAKCGYGVAMKNGTPLAKSLAKDVTQYTNNEEGVAKYLQTYFGI